MLFYNNYLFLAFCYFSLLHFIFFLLSTFLGMQVRTVRTSSYAPVEKRLTFYNIRLRSDIAFNLNATKVFC